MKRVALALALTIGSLVPATAARADRIVAPDPAPWSAAAFSVRLDREALHPLVSALAASEISLGQPVASATVERIRCRCPAGSWRIVLFDAHGAELATIHKHGATTTIREECCVSDVPAAVAAEVDTLVFALATFEPRWTVEECGTR